MKRSIYYAIALILVLGGCGSFNNSFNSYHVFPKPEIEDPLASAPTLGMDDDASPSANATTAQNVVAKPILDHGSECSVSPYPVPGQPPEIPAKGLQAAAGDVYAIERIERKHINDLRAYILDQRKRYHEARMKFIEKCITANKH